MSDDHKNHLERLKELKKDLENLQYEHTMLQHTINALANAASVTVLSFDEEPMNKYNEALDKSDEIREKIKAVQKKSLSLRACLEF